MSSTLVPVGAKKRAYKRNLVAVGLILLALGAYSVYDAKSFTTYHSTFNLLPSLFFKITDNLKDTATITGQITETGGRTVSFLIMNSLQFVQFQNRQGNASLYSVLNTGSARISYSFPSPDSYFLVFLHGSGYLTTMETVDFQRTYVALGRFELFSGALMVGLAVLLLFWGLRPRDMARPRGLPSQSETPYARP